MLELVGLSFYFTRDESRNEVERPQYRTLFSAQTPFAPLSITNASIRFRSGMGSVLSPPASLGQRQRSMTGRGNLSVPQ